MWECQWKEYKKTNTIVNGYTYPTEGKYRMSLKFILDNIMNGSIFAAVEVDIHVPDELKPYFSEMPPVFKNVTVSESDIGEFMRDYLKSRGKTFKNTRYLIGSMFGERILIITPLLKWYISHGLVVTKIYQLIEFSPKRCFKGFVETVSNDRRSGDGNPNLKPVADSSKLIGEIFYFIGGYNTLI